MSVLGWKPWLRMSEQAFTKQQDGNTQRETLLKLFHCLGFGARALESLNQVPLRSPKWMLNCPGGIRCGKESGSDPSPGGRGVGVVRILEAEWGIGAREEQWTLTLEVRAEVEARSKTSKWKSRWIWREWEVPGACGGLQWLVTKDYYED